MEYFILAVLLGLIPAFIASKKGRNFFLWWFYGVMLFIVALPMAILMKPIEDADPPRMRRCPRCGGQIQADATTCEHCNSELVPLPGSKKGKQPLKQAKEKNQVPAWLVLVAFACVGIFIWIIAGVGNSPLGMSSYTVNVSGTPGLNFSGSYMVVASGKSESRSVDGVVPQSYQLKGNIVSVSFQKKSQGGVLEVKILKDGRVVSASDTSAAYGIVTAATN